MYCRSWEIHCRDDSAGKRKSVGFLYSNLGLWHGHGYTVTVAPSAGCGDFHCTIRSNLRIKAESACLVIKGCRLSPSFRKAGGSRFATTPTFLWLGNQMWKPLTLSRYSNTQRRVHVGSIFGWIFWGINILASLPRTLRWSTNGFFKKNFSNGVFSFLAVTMRLLI